MSFGSASNLRIIATWSNFPPVKVLMMPALTELPLNNNKSPVSARFKKSYSLMLSYRQGVVNPWADLYSLHPSDPSICRLISCTHSFLSLLFGALNSKTRSCSKILTIKFLSFSMSSTAEHENKSKLITPFGVTKSPTLQLLKYFSFLSLSIMYLSYQLFHIDGLIFSR